MSGSILISGLTLYALVFCRMGGMLFFNPLMMRSNIPSQVKVALALGLTVLLTPSVSAGMAEIPNEYALMFKMLSELLIGVVFGFIFQVFYYMLLFAGDVIDMSFGLSMAKAFDPGTNIQASLSGKLLQILFVLYFFATNSHLVMIRIMASSFDLVPLGQVTVSAGMFQYVMEMFVYAFSLAVRLTLPFVAASFVLEIALGVLMKLIPQINVFVIHFQMKIAFGLFLLFLFAVPLGEAMENFLNTMLLQMQGALPIFA
jgi:flagellar biosynthetic protein FliR